MVEKKNLHKNPRSNDSIIILEFHLFRLLINKIVLIISAVKIFIFPLPIGNVRGRKCAQNAADDDIAKFVAETSGSYPPPPPTSAMPRGADFHENSFFGDRLETGSIEWPTTPWMVQSISLAQWILVGWLL